MAVYCYKYASASVAEADENDTSTAQERIAIIISTTIIKQLTQKQDQDY